MRPISQKKLRDMDCAVCGRPAWYQWSACALGNDWIPLCPTCDIKLNEQVIYTLMGKKNKSAARKVAEYQQVVASQTVDYSPKRIKK